MSRAFETRYRIAGAVTPAAINAATRDLDQRLDAAETALARQNIAQINLRLTDLSQQLVDLGLALANVLGLTLTVPAVEDLIDLESENLGVLTQGGAAALDGAAGVWHWDPQDHSETGTGRVARDPDQLNYAAPAASPTGVAGAFIKTRPKGVYRLYEDLGAEADHRPWRRATQMDPGEVLLVRPDGLWLIDEPLVFEQGGMSIVNPYGRRDYHCLLRPAQANMDLLTFASSGGVIKGINLWGLEAEMALAEAAEEDGGTYGTTRGLVLDRSVLNEGAGGANLDMRIEDCGFSGLRENITFAGRNVTIRHCSFDQARCHIQGGIYTYNNGTKTSTRGIKIHDNVFHRAGYRRNLLLDTDTEEAVIDIPIDEAIVEGDTCVNSVEVHDNYVFVSGTFYRGPASGSRVDNNTCYIAYGSLAEINDGGNSLINENHPGQIRGNLWWGHADRTTAVRYNARNAIVGHKIHNLLLADNYLFWSAGAAIKLTDVYNASIQGGIIAYANYGYQNQDIGNRAAIEIGALADANYLGVYVDGVKIQGSSSGAADYTHAVYALYGGQYITVHGGQMMRGRTGTIGAAPGVLLPTYWVYEQPGRLITNVLERSYAASSALAPTYIGAAEGFGGAIVHTDIAAAVNLAVAEFVYLNTSGKWAKIKADSLSTCGYAGMVLVAANAAAYPTVVHRGPGVKSGFTGQISPGRPLWASAATAGEVTTTAPSGSGQVVQFLGYIAVDQNGVIMDPGPPVLLP